IRDLNHGMMDRFAYYPDTFGWGVLAQIYSRQRHELPHLSLSNSLPLSLIKRVQRIRGAHLHCESGERPNQYTRLQNASSRVSWELRPLVLVHQSLPLGSYALVLVMKSSQHSPTVPPAMGPPPSTSGRS